MKFKNHRLPVWLLYTASFVVIATLSFGVLSLAGRTFIWDMDGIAQHYPIMHEFQHLLHHGGLGSLTGWSWTFGIGADKLTTLAYYVLGDPFAYLLALLPTKMLEAGYGWMVIARLYVSGLAIIPSSLHVLFLLTPSWLCLALPRAHQPTWHWEHWVQPSPTGRGASLLGVPVPHPRTCGTPIDAAEALSLGSLGSARSASSSTDQQL